MNIPIPAIQQAMNEIGAPPSADLRLDLLLSWLGSSGQSSRASRLAALLGPPAANEQQLREIYYWLDSVLFDQDQLDALRAGVDRQRPDKERRRRFRLLLSVFHPDRHPELSDWLTLRSQRINLAYTAYRRERSEAVSVEEALAELAGAPIKPGSASRANKASAEPEEPLFQGISPRWESEQETEGLISRLARDRWLAPKLFAVLSVLIAIPLISIYLDPDRTPAERNGPADVASESPMRERLRRPIVIAENWPPADHTPVDWSAYQADNALADIEPTPETSPDANAHDWPAARLQPGPAWLAEAQPMEGPAEVEAEASPEADATAAEEPNRLLARLSGFVDRITGPGQAPEDSPTIVVADQTPQADIERTAEPEGMPERPAAPPATSPRVASAEPARQPEPAAPATPPEASRPAQVMAATLSPEPEPAPALAETRPPISASDEQDTVEKPPSPVQPAPPAGVQAMAQAVTAQPPALQPGDLELGFLGNHPAGQFLATYQREVEHGNLDDIMALVSRFPRSDGGRGRGWFEDRYATLLADSEARRLSLRVLSVRRDGNDWLIDTDYELEWLAEGNGDAQRRQGRARYQLREDRGGLRIAGLWLEPDA
ncbi:MAG: hypothetical protein ACXIUB_05800 [Wenzhouxiangella sp.]